MKRLHGLRAALSLAVLLNQVALPFAHECLEAVVEARIHRGDIVSTATRAAVSRPTPPHHHHNAADCDICALASRLTEASKSPRVVSKPAAFTQLAPRSIAAFRGGLLDVPASRGPPSA